MGPREHQRHSCPSCDAPLVRLAGDPTVAYEEIDPDDGGPRTLVEHTEQRCSFHQFLTPQPGRHTLPGNADWLSGQMVHTPSAPRWERTDRTT